MDKKKIGWIVDTEFDWGGRSVEVQGLKIGLPIILDLFKQHGIKGKFFLSGELFRDHLKLIKPIKDSGHEIHAHGLFHIRYKDNWRYEQDKEISTAISCDFAGTDHCLYRSPGMYRGGYGQGKRIIGLLKSMWFGVHQDYEYIYLHPFDITENNLLKAPNLFCALWYSHPLRARRLLESWLASSNQKKP